MSYRGIFRRMPLLCSLNLFHDLTNRQVNETIMRAKWMAPFDSLVHLLRVFESREF